MGDSWFWLLPAACKQARALPRVWGSLWLRRATLDSAQRQGLTTTQRQTTALGSSAAGFQSPGVEAILCLQVGRPSCREGASQVDR